MHLIVNMNEVNMKRMLQTWHTFDDALQKVEQWLIVIGLMVILITGVASIVLRNTVGWGLAFADVLARQITVWLGLLGATLATTTGEHINIDALSRMFKRKGLQLNRVFVGLMCVIGSGVLTYCAFAFWMFYFKQPQTIELGGMKVQSYWILTIFPLAMVLMTIRYSVQTIEYIYAYRGEILPGSIAELRMKEDEEREAIAAMGGDAAVLAAEAVQEDSEQEEVSSEKVSDTTDGQADSDKGGEA